ncbi:unnamed protein product [Plutella xylostella]|uniref:(diamondback moth) hypothetical protein n=1 Tax=Plutella xylostella TaxID=51655 RepID=A0A8S4FAM3_PLUXY|nr:unnamed protein product [Plutella xylostella]
MANLSQDQFAQLLAAVRPQRSGSLAACTHSYSGEKDPELLEAFLAAVNVYKKIENITDNDALTGLPLLLRSEAATWWQGIKDSVKTWSDFETRIRNAFAPKKPAYIIYQEIMSEKQQAQQSTENFIAKKRMLFSQLPSKPGHSEEQQIDMIYGLLRLENPHWGCAQPC